MSPADRRDGTKSGRGPCGTRRAARGLTIIELMTVLTVLAVLIGMVAAPAVNGMIARHRVQGVHAEFLTDLQLARSEQAQRNGNNTSVSVTFGGNAELTCYVIHTVAAGAVCDCTRAPGNVCLPAGVAQEVKSMQFVRAAGVSVSASSPGGAPLTFRPPQGLATPNDLVVDVLSTTRGQLRTSISGLGVPNVCSPDGSIPGVRPC